MIPQGQRSHSRAPSPVRYIGEPADSRYGAEAPAYPTGQVYNDAGERPVDSATSRQAAPTCLVVDPGAAAASGIGVGTAPSAPPRGCATDILSSFYREQLGSRAGFGTRLK